MTIGHFFRLIAGVGLVSSFWKFISKSSKYDKKDVSITLILTQIFIGSTILIVFLVIRFLLFSKNIILYVIIFVLLYQLIASVYSSVLLFLREQLKSYKYVFFTIIQNLIFVVLNIIFILTLKKTYYYIIYSYLFSYIICVILSSKTLISSAKGSFKLNLSFEMIKYGFPLMIGNLIYTVITMSDRFFLKYYSTDSELGFYSYGYKYADMINAFFINVIFLAWNPIRWKVYEMKDGKKIFANFNRLLHMIFIFFTLILTGIILVLGLFLTKNQEYLNGFKILFIIAFSNVFYGLYYFNIMGLLFENKTKYITYIITVSALLNVLLNFALIPNWGMLGAAIATLISYICLHILALTIGQKFYSIERNRFFEAIQFILIIFFVIELTYIMYLGINYYYITLIILLNAILYLIFNYSCKYLNKEQIVKASNLLRRK